MGNIQGYGHSRDEALLSLAAMVRYHDKHAKLYQKDDCFYIWDGTQEYLVRFTTSNDVLQATIERVYQARNTMKSNV